MTKGRLLVAAPPLVDPNFDRSVILMLGHDADGALGLVVNRPTEHPIEAVLGEWGPLSEVSAPPGVVFSGGPVEPGGLVGLARRANGSEDLPGFSPMALNLGTVDLSMAPDEVGALVTVRIFAGYSGWGAGQLDDELEAGAWVVVDAADDDPFDPHPADLWRRVLRRQRGTVAWLADSPADLRLN